MINRLVIQIKTTTTFHNCLEKKIIFFCKAAHNEIHQNILYVIYYFSHQYEMGNDLWFQCQAILESSRDTRKKYTQIQINYFSVFAQAICLGVLLAETV